MRTIAITAFLAILAACGTVSSLRVPLTAVASTSFTFVDERSPMSRVSGATSSSARSGTFADDNVHPPLHDLVRTWLASELSAQLAGKTVRLENFDFGVIVPGAATYGQPPGMVAMQSLMTPQSVYIKISGFVGTARFAVDIYDKYYGAVTEDDLRLALAKARSSLVQEVLRAISAA
jgi:hypothetical protein